MEAVSPLQFIIEMKRQIMESCGKEPEILTFPRTFFDQAIADVAAMRCYTVRNPTSLAELREQAKGSPVNERFFMMGRTVIRAEDAVLEWHEQNCETCNICGATRAHWRVEV